MPDETSLEPFARDDKWALGAGDGALFAPRFPLWLDAPGFWDDATLHQYAVGPLFTVAVLDAHGTELLPSVVARRWTPAELMVEYRLPGGITAIETRTVQPGGVFASEWRLRSLRPATLHLVAWTMQNVARLDLQRVTWNGALGMRRTLVDRWGRALDVDIELACATTASSWSALVAERGAPHPHWRLTPFPVLWHADGLAERLPDAARRPMTTDALQREGDALPDEQLALYAAVHRALVVDGDSAAATFAMRVIPTDPALRTRALGGRQPDDEEAGPVSRSLTPASPVLAATLVRASRQRWADWLSRTPRLRADDPYIEGWMRHRWAGVRLMTTGGGAGEYDRSLVSEGPDDFHLPSAVSSAHLARDLRWLRDAPLARAAVRAWLDRVRDDGAMPARLALQHVPDEVAASTAMGDALVAVLAVVPDDAWAARLLPSLVRHAEWLEARALAALDRADVPAKPGAVVTLTADALAAIDAVARLHEPADDWARRRDRLARLAAERLWDAGRGLMHDGDRCAAAGLFLYPWLPDVDPDLRALERALTDPSLFGTPYPLPTIAGAEAGARVEPAIACRAADAIARTVVARDVGRLRPLAGRLVRRVVHTFFADGDLHRPGAFEHYDAYRGHASVYRGRDDVQRAASADLILQWLAGIRPHAAGITIDPVPSGIERLLVDNLRVRGRELSVEITGERIAATLDGTRYDSQLGEAMEIP